MAAPLVSGREPANPMLLPKLLEPLQPGEVQVKLGTRQAEEALVDNLYQAGLVQYEVGGWMVGG